jgi:lactate permease
LIANTAPVAFGAIGTPIIAMEGPTGIPAVEISKIVGRQLPLVSIFIPFYLIVIMAGVKKAKEILPAILITGISFAVTQYLTSNYLGPELPDILSALVSLLALAIFLKFWKPKTIFRFSSEQETASLSQKTSIQTYTKSQIFRAWSPFLVLTAFITLWGVPTIKLALTGHYTGTNGILKGLNYAGNALTFSPEVPLLNNKVINSAGAPVAAVYKLEILAAAGTSVLIAAIVSKFILKISWKDWVVTFGETLNEMKYPIITIASVVGFAYITNASGMSTTLGMALAKTGKLFAFFSPFLGWLGVFITGSDTSSNLLFANMQKITAESLGMNPILALAANSSGGVFGKMISPQSIAVACAAVGLVGKEGDLFRFTVKYSLLLVFLMGILITLQNSSILGWMLP